MKRGSYNIFFSFLSEGQRKANFEEYDAKKRENAEKIADLKKKIKEFYMKYARAKNVILILILINKRKQ